MSLAQIYALVLTAPPGSGALSAPVVERVREELPAETITDEAWLAPGEAWRGLLTCAQDADHRALRGRLTSCIGALPVDVNLVADDPSWRRRKLLVSDMDSTIIQQECIDEMADVMGIKPRIAAITERAMRGELDFEAALKERLALLAGLDEVLLVEVYARRLILMPGARTLVATMCAHGAFTALVSGGFSYFTSRVAQAAGFDVDHANTLEIENDCLTGRVVGPILGRDAKRQTLIHYREKLGLGQPLTLAVGDGANDLGMIQEAGLGVAFRAKPLVAAEAHAGIVHGDLTALLYLQGYRRDEFVVG